MSETKLVSLEEVAKHSSRTDVWFIIEGFVYDVTHFLDEVRRFCTSHTRRKANSTHSASRW